MNKIKFKKVSRRALSLAMLATFTITLAGCNANTSAYGNLDTEAVYSSAGNYKVSNGELWDELKWNAVEELTNQISNVVVNDYTTKVILAMKNNYAGLTQDEKNKFESEEEYNDLHKKCEERLVDYVVQDIYNFNFRSTSYWTNLESVSDSDRKRLETQYLDDLYLLVKASNVGNSTVKDLIANAGEDNSENYLKIAEAFPSVYYPSLAKEIYALEKIYEEADQADEDDDDDEDDTIGNFSKTQFVTKFKDLHANQFDLNLVLIRFSSETEYSNTLRAFGIKVYNKELYYLPTPTTVTTYDQYVKYYNDYSITNNDNVVVNLSTASQAVILQLYVEMYNYVYGGYKSSLSTGYNTGVNVETLNDLRKITSTVYDSLINYEEEQVDDMISELEKSTQLVYTRDDLDEISTTFSTYLYETLQLEDQDDETTSLPYSTSTQNYNDSYYIAYKFAEGDYKVDDVDYKALYSSTLTNDEIFDNFSENETIYNEVRTSLVLDSLTDTVMTNHITELTDKVSIKIYNEPLEIGYLVANEDYSKTLSGHSNPNVLATITYNDTTWNFNLKADSEDASSLPVAGTTNPYGAFDALEYSDGATTAIDIISRKIIKNTQAYTDTNEDREAYKDYIEALLYNFSNDGYSSSGYPSSIGKYNFMMLYFHDVNIDNIVDNYYRVSFASAKLLTDYSSDSLVDFFKTYTDKSYNNYFSLGGTRLVVYYDEDDDNEADDVTEWKNKVVKFDFGVNGLESTTLGTVAKYLVLEINNEISASTDSHATALSEIVSEINESGKIAYDGNPILAENSWAQYRYLGLNVKTEEYSCTNSSTDLDYSLKQRLFDYANGEGKVTIKGEESTVSYQYYINDTTPTEYIQPYETSYDISSDVLSLANTEIVETKDGYNLIVVTTGTKSSSAKWTEEDNAENLLTDIYVSYNDEKIKIDNVYNDSDALNANQIKLYILEYATSQTSNLLPSDIADAITNFLSPVYERYTSDATQRVVLLYFIQIYAEAELTFTDSTKSTELDEIIKINQNVADDYSFVNDDTTGTSNNFENWWDDLETVIEKFIVRDGE